MSRRINNRVQPHQVRCCWLALAMLFCLAASTVPAHATQLIINGGFETGDFTGWTNQGCDGCVALDIPSSWAVVTGPGNPVYQGNFSAVTGCLVAQCLDPVNGNWISQTVSGVVTGATYTFSMPYTFQNLVGTCAGCELDVYWGGQLKASYTLFAPNYLVPSLMLTGGSGNGSNTLEIAARTTYDSVYIDGISLTQGDLPSGTSTPEPGTFLLACGSLIALRLRGTKFRKIISNERPK